MKRNFWSAMIMVFAIVGCTLTARAEGNPTVVFTQDRQLVYENVTEGNGNSVNFGNAFEGVAPGEVRSQVITLQNNNDATVDFYMNTEVLRALEESRREATGAGYEIVLTVAGKEMYNSVLGGYKGAGENGSATGLKDMNNGVLDEDVLVATLAKGETAQVILQITFDGEAMDSQAGAVDYSNALAEVAFRFKAGYEEPTATVEPEVIVIQEDDEYITTIVEQEVPAVAVKTGDKTMFLGAAVLFFVGVGLFVFAGKKKKAEEVSCKKDV